MSLSIVVKLAGFFQGFVEADFGQGVGLGLSTLGPTGLCVRDSHLDLSTTCPSFDQLDVVPLRNIDRLHLDVRPAHRFRGE